MELKTLSARYGWLRQELIMRMNARYKVVSFLLTFIAASIAFIGIARIFEYGYAANVVILVLVGFLFVEAWRMTQIDAYLAMIESRIKQITKISLDGWETYLRSLGSAGVRPTRLLTIALTVLVVSIYTIFNGIASFASDFAYLFVNQSWLPYIKLAFFVLWEIPILYCVRKALFHLSPVHACHSNTGNNAVIASSTDHFWKIDHVIRPYRNPLT